MSKQKLKIWRMSDNAILPKRFTAGSVGYDISAAAVKVPSIHMPRWASRITLEITGLRDEHIQDIVASDCLYEGIEGNPDSLSSPVLAISIGACTSVINKFKILWDSINKKRGYGWDTNPLVKVISFLLLMEYLVPEMCCPYLRS